MEVQEVPEAEVQAHVERLRRFKEGRDKKALETALTSLREQAAGRATNLFPAAMEAIEAGATLGELNGYVRQGFGYSYDDLGANEAPF